MRSRRHIPHANIRVKLARMERKVKDLEGKVAELQELAETDSLTNLPNRRGFERAFAGEEYRASRNENATITLVCLDVDHFKKVNDTYGHPTGDAVLRKLGEILRKESRASDVLGRIGGEEFAIAFQGGSARANFAHIERLRKTVAEQLIITASGQTISVTASFGMAEKKPAEEIESLLARADSALYAAKQAGRNQVVHADH